MARNFEICLDPDAFVPPASAHADRVSVQNRIALAFDQSTVEAVYSKAITMSTSYTGAGTLKCDIYYSAPGATSGKVDFEVSVEAITNGDALDLGAASSFDSVNAGNQTVPGTAGNLSVLTITLTNKDGVAVGDLFRIKLERDADDATDDTADGDARVWLVVIYEEV
jgi:hypothetical protein